MQIHYRNQEGSNVMLPSGRHIVDKHGTIHAPQPKLTKRERAKIKRQAKRVPMGQTAGKSRIGAFFA